MSLSKKAWEKSLGVYNAIINHPFNQELMQGTLDKEKFAYYIEQDVLYLQDFSKCHTIIASRIGLEYMQKFLKYAEYTLIAEQEVVHHFFEDVFNFKKTNLVSPATHIYTGFMLKSCISGPVEVAVASILPCLWVYREVGLFIAKHSDSSNPYYRWIDTYAGEDFAKTVEEAIAIFDDLADKTTDAIREKMLEAFYQSVRLEWHFWNDSYKMEVFDKIEFAKG